MNSLHNLAKHLHKVHTLAQELGDVLKIDQGYMPVPRPDWGDLSPEDQRAWIAVTLEVCKLSDVIAATARRLRLTPAPGPAKSGEGG